MLSPFSPLVCGAGTPTGAETPPNWAMLLFMDSLSEEQRAMFNKAYGTNADRNVSPGPPVPSVTTPLTTSTYFGTAWYRHWSPLRSVPSRNARASF